MSPRSRVTPRKQPCQDRSRETVEALLEATARVLVKEGFDRASTNRIAQQAGVSIGSLYQYFPSKEALVTALARRHMDEMLEAISGKLHELADAPVAVAVRTMVELMIRAHAVDPRLHRALMEQIPLSGHLDRLRTVEDNVFDIARAYFERHKSELRCRDLDLATFLVCQTIEGVTHATIAHRREFDAEALADELTTLVLSYLMARGSRVGRDTHAAK